MTDHCPLTVAEARAILIADHALDATYGARLASGQVLGLEEGEAWRKLVKSADARIAAYERPIVVPLAWRISTVSTKMLMHAFNEAAWSLCGMVQFANTVDFDPALFQDRCKACVRFARKCAEPTAP